MHRTLVSLDLETTGLDIQRDSIIEIGAVKILDGTIVDKFETLVNPGFVISAETSHITHIYPEDLRNAPPIEEVLASVQQFVGDAPVIAHNAAFDLGFMRRFGILKKNIAIDTYELASLLLPSAPRYSLGTLAELLDLSLENQHRALADAQATGLLYWKLWEIAYQLPRDLIQEILHSAQAFDWELRPVFEDAARKAPEQIMVKTLAAGDITSESFNTAITTEPIPDTKKHISAEEINVIFQENGPLKESIPGFEQRQQQIDMAQAVTQALNEGQHVLIEAGTGTGKSLAYLVPAALWAEKNQTRVAISTDTINLQDQLINKDIPLTRAVLNSNFRAAVMKGRSNYLCPRRLNALRRRQPTNIDELRTMIKVLVWIQKSQTGDRGEINLRASEQQIWQRLSAQDEGCTTDRCSTVMGGQCPFYRARKAAEAAHILIVNHALLVVDALNEHKVLPHYNDLIVDEAHQLEDAVTHGSTLRVDLQSLTRRLSDLGGLGQGIMGDLLRSAQGVIPDKTRLRLEAFIEDIDTASKAMRHYLRQFFGALFDLKRDTREGVGRSRIRIDERRRRQTDFGRVIQSWRQLNEFFEVFAEALEHLTSALTRLEKYDIPDFDDHLHSTSAAAGFYREMHERLLAFVEHPDTNTVYWLNAGESAEDMSIEMAPLNIGPLMEQHIWQNKNAVVLTSATLRTSGNFDYIRSRLYAEDAKAYALGSPFNYQQSTLVYVPEDMPEPNRNDYQMAVERGIIELAVALGGRVMTLFTSYNHLRETAAAISPQLAAHNIIVYDQATGGSREALLENFRSTDRAVLLGTRSFWQGIDIPGDDLSALVIVRLPFSVPNDPIFAARAETYRDSFNEYAVPEAILRFRQGFGRLIRTSTDRGVVAVFDSRIISKSYGLSFLESLPDCTIQYGPLASLARVAAEWLS